MRLTQDCEALEKELDEQVTKGFDETLGGTVKRWRSKLLEWKALPAPCAVAYDSLVSAADEEARERPAMENLYERMEREGSDAEMLEEQANIFC